MNQLNNDKPAGFFDSGRAGVLLLLLTVSIPLTGGLAILPDYGITIDEPLHHASGELNVNYFLSVENPIVSYHNLRYYGPFSDMLGHVMFRFLSHWNLANPVDARHVHLVIFFALSAGLMFMIASESWGNFAGAIAALLFGLCPRLLGHAPNNPKSIPLIFWSLLFLWMISRYRANGRYGWLVAASVTAGLGFATKIDMLFCVMAAWVVLPFCNSIEKPKHASRVLRNAVLFVSLFTLTVLLVWPWLRMAPMSNLPDMVRFYAHHPRTGTVLYRGIYYPVGGAPWHYGPVYFLITTPLTILCLSVLGFSLIRFRHATGNRLLVICFAWLVAGVIPRILPGAVVYDGPRHLMFLYPALILPAALGAVKMADFLKERFFHKQKWAAYLPLAAVLLHLAWTDVDLHPYQTCYYNVLAGGLKNVRGKFEIWDWGHGLRQVAREINREAPAGCAIYVAYPPGLLRYYLRPDVVESNQNPSYLITSVFREPGLPKDFAYPFTSIGTKDTELYKIYRLTAGMP